MIIFFLSLNMLWIGPYVPAQWKGKWSSNPALQITSEEDSELCTKPLLSAQTVGVFVISPIRRVKLHKATFATGYDIFFGNTSNRGHYDRTAANNSPVWLGDLSTLHWIYYNRNNQVSMCTHQLNHTLRVCRSFLFIWTHVLWPYIR